MAFYGVCKLGVISVRKTPDEKSELVTQILFGETFQILEKKEKWSYVELTFDNYEGWINTDVINNITENEYYSINSNISHYVSVFSETITDENKNRIIIPFGSSLPHYNPSENSIRIDNTKYQLLEKPLKINDIINISNVFLNAPYLWGGKTPFGIDCSGFVQLVYKTIDIKLPRDAKEQAEIGKTINFISEVQNGDLAFFDNNEGNIIHTGIIINKNKIIHASGHVRVDNIDHQGIYNKDKNKYTHKLRIIKRILN